MLKERWEYLRTTNIIEGLFGAVQLRTDAAKRFSKIDAWRQANEVHRGVVSEDKE